MTKRWRAFALAIVVVAASCQNPVEPGAAWIVGHWRWTAWCGSWECMGLGGHVFILSLHGNGDAIVREQGVVTLRTEYRAQRDKSAAGIPYAIWFDDAVAGGTRFGLSSVPTDTLGLEMNPEGCDDCGVYLRFQRVR